MPPYAKQSVPYIDQSFPSLPRAIAHHHRNFQNFHTSGSNPPNPNAKIIESAEGISMLERRIEQEREIMR